MLFAIKDLQRKYEQLGFSTIIPPVLWFYVYCALKTCKMREKKIQVQSMLACSAPGAPSH